MKFVSICRFLSVPVLLFSFFSFVQAQQNASPRFRENKGQVMDQNGKFRSDILFSGEQGPLHYHLSSTGISYQLFRVESQKLEQDPRLKKKDLMPGKQVPDQIGIYRVDIEWLGANRNVVIKKNNPLPGVENFYNVPEGVLPALNVQQYESLTYSSIYPGIDLHWFVSENGQLEYDFIVHPGADPSQIRMKISGASIKVGNNNELILSTPFGEITEGALKVFQEGKKIRSNWKIEGDVVRFIIPTFDPSKTIRIDPPVAVREWGTYYGGTSWDVMNAIQFDQAGDIVATGWTLSSNNIATSGAHQSSYSGGRDVMLVKFSSAGTRIWATYAGGFGQDDAQVVSVDPSDNIFISGTTSSTNAIATAGAYQSTFAGAYDVFFMKFSSTGVRQWGTYYGGTLSDYVYGIEANGSNELLVTGYTESTSGIATVGSHLSSYQGGAYDAFLAKLDGNGTMSWATYFGGPGDDYAYGASFDAAGNIYLGGSTNSIVGITTTGSYQENFAGGDYDGYVARFSNAGGLTWSTYFGGFDLDDVLDSDADDAGNVVIVGWTMSPAGIATTGAHQETYNDYGDGYILKFNSSGIPEWGTYYGGEGNELIYDCQIDDNGNVYASGSTESFTGIASSSPHQGAPSAYFDGFFVKLDQNGQRLYASYYGGSEFEGTNAIYANTAGDMLICSSTDSPDGISSVGSYQAAYGGGTEDAYMALFRACESADAPSVSISLSGQICPNIPVQLSVTSGNLNENADWEWYADSCGGTAVGSGTSVTVTPAQATTYYVRGTGGTCAAGECSSVLADAVAAPLQDLCVVTTDSATASYNIVVWEKDPATIDAIDSFYIYREITLGNFVRIGAVHADSLSQFDDLTANPNATSYSYKISALDTCGTESDLSLYHKSIHLQYFGSGNFQWNLYEIESTANQVASYNFYRDDLGVGNYQVLQVIPGGNNSFTDVNYLLFPNAGYRVDVNWINGDPCIATRAINHNTTRSNRLNGVANGILESIDEVLSIFPNPNNGTFVVKGISLRSIELLNSIGQVVYVSAITSTEQTVITNQLPEGIYFVRIHSDYGILHRKIVIGVE